MSDKRPPIDVNRRALVSAFAVTGAASLVGAGRAAAQGVTTSTQTGGESSSTPSGKIPAATNGKPLPAEKSSPPTAKQMWAETEKPAEEPVFVGRTGSDYMVDVLKALDIDYMATMPGSSFRGLHELIINYGENKKPELLTCLHEEIVVGMCHGYAKTANKPMAALLHGVVGVQHSAMAVYNAWADRVPILMIAGNNLDASKRRQGAEWEHSSVDNGAMLRSFTKWDAQPVSLDHFAESTLRGYALAVEKPSAPVLIMADSELQEKPIDAKPKSVPGLNRPRPPVGDGGALAEAARMLVNAQNPVIIVDKLVSTPEGMQHLITLAETLQAPVVDKYGRMNMPNTHYLNQTGRGRALLHNADVILGLELSDFWGTVNTLVDVVERYSHPTANPKVKLIGISTHSLLIKSNFQDFQRYQPIDLDITGDGQATLPYLIEAVKKALPSGHNAASDGRAEKMKAAHKKSKEQARLAASYGWDATPISTARMCAEVWPLIKDSDWALTAGTLNFMNNWPLKLWDVTKHYQYGGGTGGGGVGYGAPAGIGSALAHREHGRLVIGMWGDGDLMCCSAALWTAAHHKIPLVAIVHNNRAYHQELMHVQRMANRHQRGIDRTWIGTTIQDPPIDFAKVAQGLGIEGIGPVVDPNDLGPALKKAVALAKAGEPVLVDVVSQGR